MRFSAIPILRCSCAVIHGLDRDGKRSLLLRGDDFNVTNTLQFNSESTETKFY